MRKLTGLQWIIVLLTLATALIHIFLGVSSWGTNTMMGAIFILDGVGYIVIVSLLYFSGRVGRGRTTMRWILIAYAFLTVVLYFVFNGAGAFSNILGLITKGIEVLLIVLLLVDRRSDAVPATTPAEVATSAATRAVTTLDAATMSAGASASGPAGAAAAAAAASAAANAADDALAEREEAVVAEDDLTSTRFVGVQTEPPVAAGVSREALDNFFGDIDRMTPEEWRAKLMGHLALLGDTKQFDEPIEYVEGIGDVRGRKWRAVDMTRTIDLLVFGATRKGRAALAKRSGFEESQILTWANQVDLYRIVGIGKQYADLLEQSGVDTVIELANRNPANLQKLMVEVNERRQLVRRTPTLAEVEKWVEQAATLPRVMHY